ncbi:thioesterase domain-containing protein [Dyella jiangningensis]|uniref:thioesterase domain-containing protein n=1 Tax=Dyella jiangningensis TaxID=1379159 RepID=UPI002410253A|nr:thioesterase domain-containing protein [Dyella jiangningensis]
MIVDRFPLTVNGKIDAAALRRLPSPDSHASGSSPDNPPIGDGEILIARLWSELLDTPIASRDANFFEMGGNSLLAAVFAERMRACGRAFPGMRIFERPVLSDLAAALASPVQATLGPAVIPVRRRQGGTNVFFFPTGTGDYSYTFELATDMDSSIGIYALPWPDSLDGVDLDALARAMCEAMMCVQPAGPYLLCGYSLGGLLAHAVAAHLLRSGHPVSFIGLIDVPTGSPYQENGAPKTPRNFILRSIRSKAAQKSPEALEQAVDFIHRARTWAMVDIIEQGRSIGLLNPPAERTSAEMAIAWERSFGFLQAASCYRPGPESMSIEIFQATLQEHHDAPPSPAWNEISPSYDIHTTHVDGGHEDLMNVPETRRQLAAALSRRILLAMPERELAG